MVERFDVLNERGDYTGRTETREECHRNGLWHRAVAIFIINSNNQVLLQRRSKTKKMWPNMWDVTAGGHVDAGEFGFETVIRETKEELGIELDNNNITFIGSAISSHTKNDILDNHFNEYYIVNKDIDITKLSLDPEEVSEVKWINKDEILDRINNEYDGITNKQGCWEYLAKYYEWLSKK